MYIYIYIYIYIYVFIDFINNKANLTQNIIGYFFIIRSYTTLMYIIHINIFTTAITYHGNLK
jgi:hypothetical protein